jgi:nucleoside-diphosphate-sugar epimerase
MKKCLVLGAAGFLGGHMEERLKRDGHFVVSLSRNKPRYREIKADEYNVINLVHGVGLYSLLGRHQFDEVYNFAAEVGGLGYIQNPDNDVEILRNSTLINLNVLDAVSKASVSHPIKLFFASSACVYGNQKPLVGIFREEDAYPAQPDNTFGWEKIFAERLYDAYYRNHGLDIRIARFGNTYGPYCVWDGPRAKAPAAICRRVAGLFPGQDVEIWGDGSQTRSFTYVDDAIDGAIRLMANDYHGPVNIASSELVTIKQLVETVCKVASKPAYIKQVPGPIGVHARNLDDWKAKEGMGWEAKTSLAEGIAKLYPWVDTQYGLTLEKARG